MEITKKILRCHCKVRHIFLLLVLCIALAMYINPPLLNTSSSVLQPRKCATHSLELIPQNSTRTDAVILLTMMRSGSSFVGSIFNERKNVTYLYEPLFPFGESCDSDDAEDRLRVLRHITRCEFNEIPKIYKQAFGRSKVNDIYARCQIHGICFSSSAIKSLKFLSRDAEFCYKRLGRQHCPEPLDLVQLNKHCKHSLLKAMKVIYLCKLEWISSLLEDPNYNIKVVHLVRDPRSTIKSRTSPQFNLKTIKYEADRICNRIESNVKYADDFLSKSRARDKYLRIRYEDFAWNPIAATSLINNFIGISNDEEVTKWLADATNPGAFDILSTFHTQGLKRNPATVLSAWRQSLSFDKIKEIQGRCSKVLQKLGYTVYDNESELKDISKLHFSPNCYNLA